MTKLIECERCKSLKDLSGKEDFSFTQICIHKDFLNTSYSENVIVKELCIKCTKAFEYYLLPESQDVDLEHCLRSDLINCKSRLHGCKILLLIAYVVVVWCVTGMDFS